MKGKWKKALGASLLALAFSGAFGMVACGDKGGSGSTPDVGGVTDQQIMAAYSMYKDYMASKDQAPLSYEEWLESLKGEKGDTPAITIVGGYWYVDGVNTGVKAVGEDAQAPEIEIIGGYWYVNGESTGVKATGENGAKPVITINPNGYWCVDGVSTGVKAKGAKGDDGEDGVGIDDIAITYGVNGDGETVMIFTFYMSNGQTIVKEVVIGENPPAIPDDPDQGGDEDDEPETYTIADGTEYSGLTITLNDDGSVSVEDSDYAFTYEWDGDALAISDEYSTYYFAVEETTLVAYVPDMDYETYVLSMMDAFVYIYNDNSTQSGEYFVRSYKEFEEDDGTTSVYTSTFKAEVDFENFVLYVDGGTYSFVDGGTLRAFIDVGVSAGSILGENARLYMDTEDGGVIVIGDDEYEWTIDYETRLVVVSYPMNDLTQEILFTLDHQNGELSSFVPDGTNTTYTNAEMEYSLCLYDEYCVIADINNDVLYTCARVEEDDVLLIAGMKVVLNDDFTYSFVTDGGEDDGGETPDNPTLPEGVEYAFVGEVRFQVDMRVNKIELYDDSTAKMYYYENETEDYVEWTNLEETVVWTLDGNALYLGLGDEPCALFGVDLENGTLSEYDFANETVENVYTFDDGGMYVHTITTYGNGFLRITLGSFNYTLPYEIEGKTLTLLPTSYGMSFTINDDKTLTWNEEDDDSEVTVLGVYTYTNAAGQSYEMTLYSNNTVEQNGSVLPCTVEGNILRIMMGDSPMYFELDETDDGEKVMTDYVPELPILNTYTYQEYRMTFTVYGVYTGANSYIAIYSIATMGGTQQATTEVELDLDAGTLTHAVGTFTINDDNTLTMGGGNDTPADPNDPSNPDDTTVAYTLTGNVYLLIEVEVSKIELLENDEARVYYMGEYGEEEAPFEERMTWEITHSNISNSTELKLFFLGGPCAIYNVDLENGTISEYVFDEKMKDATYTYTETEESDDGISTYTQTFTTYLNGFALWSDDDGDSAVVAYMVRGDEFYLLPRGFSPIWIIGENNELTVNENSGIEDERYCKKCETNFAVTGGYCDTCLGKVEATYDVEAPFCYMFGETATLYENNICLLYSEGDYLDLTYEIQGDLVVLNVPDAFGSTFGMYFVVENGTLVHYVPNATPSIEYVDETTGTSFKTYEDSGYVVLCMGGMEMYTAEARVMMDGRIYVAGSYVEFYDDGTCKLYCPMCNKNFVCDECAEKMNGGNTGNLNGEETTIDGSNKVIIDSMVQLG